MGLLALRASYAKKKLFTNWVSNATLARQNPNRSPRFFGGRELNLVFGRHFGFAKCQPDSHTLSHLLTRLRRPRFNLALVSPPHTPALQANQLAKNTLRRGRQLTLPPLSCECRILFPEWKLKLNYTVLTSEFVNNIITRDHAIKVTSQYLPVALFGVTIVQGDIFLGMSYHEFVDPKNPKVRPTE